MWLDYKQSNVVLAIHDDSLKLVGGSKYWTSIWKCDVIFGSCKKLKENSNWCSIGFPKEK